MYADMEKKKSNLNNSIPQNSHLYKPVIQCSRLPKWMRFATLGIFDPLRYLPRALGGYGPYTNRLVGSFDAEFDQAAQGIQGGDYGPVMISDPRVAAFFARNNHFKWIYDRRDGIILIEPQYKHSIAAAGADVVTGGSGVYQGAMAVQLNNDTGHFRTDYGSLYLAESAWRAAGYTPTFRDRPELPRMFGGD